MAFKLAARGILAAALLFASFGLCLADEAKKAQIDGYATSNQSNPSQSAPDNGGASASYYETLCKTAKEANDRDLCQQWRMAEAARQQVKWTRAQFWAIVAEILALVVTLAFVIQSTRAAKESVRAATDSNRISREMFTSEQRPWISTEAAVNLNLTYDDKGGRFGAAFRLANVGKSPATNVWLNAEAYCLGSGAPLEALRTFCESHAVLRGEQPGDILFPGQSFSRRHHLLLKQEDIDAMPDLGGMKMIIPIVLVCVTYKSELTGRIHQTGQAFILIRQADDGNAAAILPEQGEVDRELLGFDIYPGASLAT